MWFLIQLKFVIAQWVVYYSSFHRPQNIYCSDSTCPYGFKQDLSTKNAIYVNCTNPIGSSLILSQQQMTAVSNYQYYSQNPYSINHTIVFDVYYVSRWNNDILIFEYINQAYLFEHSTQNPLQFVNGACNSSDHEVRTYQISLPYTNAFTNLKFSITNSQTTALIKNIHFSYISCHSTCRTCTGESYNQCTSCFGIINLQDGICRCPQGKTKYGSRCLDYCLLGYTDRRQRYCQYYQPQYFLYLYQYEKSYSQLFKWDIIYDPKYLINQNKKTLPYFGIFRYNEGTSTIVNTTYFVYPLGVQIYIYMCNQTPKDSGISLYLNNTYFSSIYHNGTQYITDNLYLYNEPNILLNGCQSAKALLLYANLYVDQGSFTFSIKGNFTSGDSGWYLIYTLMSSAHCPLYCLKCEKDYFCSNCISGYIQLSDGRCTRICPKTSILLNNICVYYNHVTKYSQYFLQQFYDFTVPDDIKQSFILESSTIKDFQKGNEIYWSYVDTNVVFGGKYVWATARFSQIYNINKAHHSITIYFDAVFGCNFDSSLGYLGYSVNNQTEESVDRNSTVSINIPNYSPTLTIAFQCYGETNNVLDQYCGIQHYYIVVHYCSPYCLQCLDENTCLLMDTYDTTIIKLDQSECSSSQYLDYEYFKCEDCPQECETCLNEFECITCKSPYTIFINKCLIQCQINEYFDEEDNICKGKSCNKMLECHHVCKQCKLRDKCINCEQSKFRYLFYNQCLCYDGYYDDNINVECQVCDILCKTCFGASKMNCNECISISNVEKVGNTCDCISGYYFEISNLSCVQCHKKCQNCFASFENSCLSCNSLENRILDGLNCQCDIGYFEQDDICVSCPNIDDLNLQQCYKQCGDNQKIWFNQICLAFNCQIGFINQNDQCLPICGDGLKHGNEECDDNNNILDDGCYNCRFQCPKECLTCNELTTFPCLNLCGDGILSGEEECDDGNSIQFDGCYQCKIECQNQCTLCMRGLCYQCQTYGWIVEIDSKTCIENCGDLITIGREQCDDGLDDNQNDGCYQCKRVCRNDCLTCSSNGQTCLECKIVGFRPFSYYCRNICGDGYLAIDPFDRNSEECDDFNLTNFDGCSSTCKFQCQSNVCKTCVNNKCIECIDNYYLNQNQNKCIEQCNDNIIIGSEICEDMNSLLYDGCYNCQLSCQSSCSNCTINGCLSCFQGYQLVGIHCKPICGDKLIVIQEDCDDGNLIPFDGCHFCKYSCSQHCHTCYNGQCIMCQHNYIRYNGLCVQTIQFNQIFKIYSHSINLDQFIQNKPSNAFYEFCKEVINDICIVCQEFYSLNVISNCQSQCGDNIISGYEQCEDSITQNNIVCNECQLVCSDNCIYCQFGICLQCGEGYYLKLINNICEPIKQCTDIGLYYDIENNLCFDICGDGIKSKQELCDDDNDDPYDGCYKCQYSCLPNCPLCIQGQCVDDGNTCNEGYYFDTQKAECYNICGDGILSLPDEDCDNGTLFNIQDDQCQNCKIICAKSCQVCNLNNQCISCKKNYELLDGKCYPKDFNQHLCKIDNCDYCEDTQCITCSIGFTYHIIQNECQPICGDGIIIDKEQCDDGNLINGDGCDQNCQPSQDSQCVNNQCVPIQYPVPLLKFEKEIDNSQIVYLTFDQQVKLSFNYSIPLFIKSINTFLDDKAINVTFNEISTLNQEQLSNLQIQIIINFQEISNNPIFSIQFSDLNIIINEFGITSNHQNVSIQLPSPNFLSQKQQQLTASLVKFSTYQIQIIAGLILASSLSGKFEIIQNQIDLIQQLYYLKYINTRKGQNLIKFFGTFKIIQLASFYQFIGFNPSNDLFFNFSFQKSESIFEEDGRNANYLSNFISILTIFVFAYFTHLSIQLLIKYFMNHIKSLNIINFNKYQLYGLLKITKFSIKNCRNKFHNQFKGLLQSLIYEYIISSFLSLIYQDFNSAEGRLSFIANGIMQYLLINYLLSQEYQKQKSYSQFTYSCIQKMLFGIILIVCFKSAIIQIQLCTLNEFFYFYYLYQQKKQLDKLESFKKQFLHFNLFIINLFFLINEVYRNDTEKILYYGWVIIALMSFILSITLFIDIFKITSPFILKIISYIKAQKPQFINHEIFDQPEQQRQLF